MKPQNAIALPDVIERFRAYHAKEPCWGVLHIVLDDGNVRDGDVKFCIEDALERGDTEGHELACLLLGMSVTQRRKLTRI